MIGSQWAVYEQVALPNGNLHFYPAAHAITNPSGGVEFSMPNATTSSPAYANYLLNAYTASLSYSDTITAKINIVPSSAATTFVGNPDGHNSAMSFVRLFIQSNLPHGTYADCIATGNSNYWWATPTDGSTGSYTFGTENYSATLSVTLNPTDWSNVCGLPANYNSSTLSSFYASIANIKYFGLSFGSGGFLANGVGVNGTTGMAIFQLENYTIK
jgi:hypothetical protein